MRLILCLDDRNGLAFNKRRLSRDVAVCHRILELCGKERLWMNSYSYKLFAQLTQEVTVEEDFFDQAGTEDFCFAEISLPAMEKVSDLYVFRWNRAYPSDTKLNPEDWGFSLKSREEFIGNSHPCIALEVYSR